MSGQALKHVDSHSAIHEAALNEARELNDIMSKLLRSNQKDKAMEVALVAVEHWETRTLRHADAEEEGLYKELVEESPELRDDILSLTRDHDMMRFLVKEVKEMLEKDGFIKEVLEKFHTLVHIDAFHNIEEERILPHY
ncbi:hypothetical protein GWK91_00045 [Virgibacillus sp. MSP4-1]|uniref:hypothetical protein n=1 Tax=Virgibacillus sp. MSP4-1 TaxID=2700081 RepID=UPI0003A7F9B3|nr:hypothetical protein [Virgibacillus sp. MSP4-1]QHS21445.1 hypothetical protein GWK91_00045 [Virgibacillus sp. MSP4-1]